MNGNDVDTIYQAFANHGPAIQAALMTIALELFWGLAIIELAWSIGKSVAHKTDILDIIYLVANQLIVLGFFQFLVLNWANFAKAITDSFAVVGGKAAIAMGGTPTMMPVGMIMAGVHMTGKIWAGMNWKEPFVSSLLLLSGVFIALVFGYFAVIMIEVLIECFIQAYVGVVMMAFSGTVYLREFAISQVRYSISVGVKRLVMQLIAGVSEAIVNGWSAKLDAQTASFAWADIALMFIIPVCIARLAMRMPGIAQDTINGAHLNAAGNLFTTGAAIATAATAAAISVTGAGAAIGAGAASASKQMGGMIASGTAPASRVGQAAKMVGMAGRATGQALAADVGRRLSGNYGATHGYRGFRVAAELNRKRQQQS